MIEDIFVLPTYAIAYGVFVAFLAGLVFGSFGNAWAYRVIHGEKISKGRSHCPICGHTLGPADLVPLISYIIQKGKCRYCMAPISVRYPASELICAVIFTAYFLRFGITLKALCFMGFGFFLFVLSLADYESFIIPDRFVLGAAAFGILTGYHIYPKNAWAVSVYRLQLLENHWLSVILEGLILAAGLLLIVLVFDFLTRKEAMGGGDIKLMFAVGCALGVPAGVLSLFISCIIGLFFALIPGIKAKNRKDITADEWDTPKNLEAFPFGPSICIAVFLVSLIGNSILSFYFGLF